MIASEGKLLSDESDIDKCEEGSEEVAMDCCERTSDVLAEVVDEGDEAISISAESVFVSILH